MCIYEREKYFNILKNDPMRCISWGFYFESGMALVQYSEPQAGISNDVDKGSGLMDN